MIGTLPKNTLLVILAIFICGLFAVVFVVSERYFLRNLVDENAAAYRLTKSGLEGALLRYEPIAPLIADKDEVAALLRDGDSDRISSQLNAQLSSLAEKIDASDIYVMDKTGRTIASSNFNRPRSFLGQNFSYRPYFTDAIAGSDATYFALGTTSLIRGYYYSAPVRDRDEVIGVVAVKVTVDSIEASWRNNVHDVLVVDDRGIIFMSSRDEWRFKSIDPLSDAALAEIKTSRQYPIEQLGQLQTERWTRNNIEFFDMKSTSTMGEAGELYVSAHAFVEATGWTLYVMTPASRARALTFTVMLFAALGLAVLMLIIGMIAYRRAKLMESIETQQRVQQELELRVEQRTQDLRSANQNLQLEVQERTQAEQRLLQTQRELVQAGKLAALGKMAASLSHEINQPLAAIRAYAGNASAFIQRGNTDQASENLGHIETMADRMGGLIKHLKNFARKPKESIGVVDLGSVLSAVETIMRPELNNKNATLTIQIEDEPVYVRGGLVRLQQVFVNLINNGLDSMSDQNAPHIDLTVQHASENFVLIEVRDFGDGIDASLSDKIFDPFFTTKEVNQGLGLGLSISYNIIQDCGGELSFENHPEKGAVFTVKLEDAARERMAAE